MKLAIVTDAWSPQVNGVVTTLAHTRRCLEAAGHSVWVESPSGYRTLPCPTYPEIRLALCPARRLRRSLERFAPDAIHIATEGPLGLAASGFCRRRGLAFTTSYHTQFPQYVRKRVPIPESLSYAFLRRHHGAARRTLVGTPHQRDDLVQHGFSNVVLWSRGVDTDVFTPGARGGIAAARPIFLYAGRVAIEKNLEAFLDLDLPGSKVIVGGGPDSSKLAKRYPDAHFVGYKFGRELAAYMSAADVFVFPSRTDTFGIVMLEAMACGTPIAAYPVTGPIDVVEDGVTGVLDENLGTSARKALQLDRRACRNAALQRTWQRATAQFVSYLVCARTGGDLADALAARGLRGDPCSTVVHEPCSNA
jgi:glycosyltransferase involved in cell wall biosynthesis